MAKLTEKTRIVFDFVKENDKGDGVKMEDIAIATGLTIKQVGPIVWTSLKEKKDGSRPALVSYEKRMVDGSDKPVGYVHLTDAGKNYVETDEDIAE